jgi:hypothetical protein
MVDESNWKCQTSAVDFADDDSGAEPKARF